MVTGTLALTAFWLAFASASASCFVLRRLADVLRLPGATAAGRQLELPPVCVAVAAWPVVLLFDEFALAVLLAD